MSLPATSRYMGLAPFLRQNIAGGDLRPIAQALLDLAGQATDNACLWMNLATAMFCIGEQKLGLSIQGEALQQERRFEIPANTQPARARLLVIAVTGDIAENTPIDCLLEGAGIDLSYYFATAEAPLPSPLPAHDALLVAIADSATSRPLLARLDSLLARWPKPVINRPSGIPHTERSTASRLLQDIPGLCVPPVHELPRATLAALAAGHSAPAGWPAGLAFPLIMRPVGSQAGRDLARLAAPAELPAYLDKVADARFYVAPFIDYSSADGRFRKYRVALVAGQPFACHMGISDHWMIHYLNAGMYEDAAKRAEEARFMGEFSAPGGFAERHRAALDAIARRCGLDYVLIDCGETPDGRLLIFEIDHVMVIHAMDPIDRFPYKQAPMQAVREAFVQLILPRQPAGAA